MLIKTIGRSAHDGKTIEARGLEEALQRRVRGEVRFDAGSRALYATDGSNYRQVPIGVVLPKDEEDVVAAVACCREFHAPVLPRGAGTSLAGQSCNVAVVLDFTKYMHQLLELDPEGKRARVQPGLILDHLRAAAERQGLTFGPDPATHNRCTLGGMIGNNSCGVHSVMAGRTSDNVEELEVLTYDGVRLRVGATSEGELERAIAGGGRPGEIYARLRALRDRYAEEIRTRYPAIPRRVSGYNLPDLLPEKNFHLAQALVGSEGTCATVLQAVVRLVPSPAARVLVVLAFPTVFEAADRVMEVMAWQPVGLEGLDEMLVQYMRRKGLRQEEVNLLPDGDGWLLVEFGGDTEAEARHRARGFMAAAERWTPRPAMQLYEDRAEQHHVWKVRESGLAATAHVPDEPEAWTGWEDSAVPPPQLGEYLRALRRLFERYGYEASLYGHFGQGCVHTRIPFDLTTRSGIDRYRAFLEQASELVLRLGGSLSGEHGDGQSRAELLPKMFGPALIDAFREFKSIWDPEWKMNPGKVIDAAGIAEHLRLGTRYRPPEPETHFAYTIDGGSFANTALRCVGVGECVRMEGGTMCPSYMVTREEKHSTRGRAHLLFEMLQGDPLRGGWREDAVKDALDLCLACKGCLGECPVQVDMATYKAEFLAHYYRGRLRPRAAYAMGFIQVWARLASWAPSLANLAAQLPGLRALVKLLGGIARQRGMPRFARETFVDWFRRRPDTPGRGHEVGLWPDTFTNYFYPETGKAAVEVLEQAGCRVLVPARAQCCGRPLYDFGFVTDAKAYLQRILRDLQPWIEAGLPIVVLEPSCLAVFRNELPNLLPHDEDAKRLMKQSLTLGEFLTGHVPGYRPPQLERRALVHGHCHQKAVVSLAGEERLFRDMGLDVEVPDSGCCGMAGAFGFKEEHYDISIMIGERVLLPAVRAADPQTLIVADGFSCREQIAQTTPRRALHLAQVIQMALHEGPQGPRDLPEAEYPAVREATLTAAGRLAWIGGGLVTGAALVWAVGRMSGVRR